MNCKLRALESSDLSAVIEAENHQEAYMNSDNYMPFSRAVLEKYVNGEHDFFKFQQYRYVIDLDGECAGFLDLFDYNAVHARAGVGVFVLEPFRERGVAGVALQRLITEARQKLNIEYLHASISEENKPSIKLFEKCGFTQAGFKRGWRKENGVRKGVKLYELILV